ncbi:MAG TPA: hypothetical protein VK553_04845 [Candidatus Nitrosopolaris rasttigaisensis]|nr:hypothetical protein [Candidatus Nitrosopolaris rasttigaisensis]
MVHGLPGIVKGINDTINSILQEPAFQDLQDDVKETIMGQIGRARKDSGRYSQEAFANYTKPDAFTKLLKLDAHLIKMSAGLRIAKGINDTINSIYQNSVIQDLQDNVKGIILGQIERVQKDFAQYSQKAFQDCRKPDAFTKLLKLGDHLEGMSSGLNVAKGINDTITLILRDFQGLQVNPIFQDSQKYPAFQRDVKEIILDQLRRVRKAFADYSQEAFADCRKPDAFTKLEVLGDVLTKMHSSIGNVNEIITVLTEFDTYQRYLPAGGLDRKRIISGVKLFSSAFAGYNKAPLKIDNQAGELVRANYKNIIDNTIKSAKDICKKARECYEYCEAYRNKFEERLKKINKRIDDCRKIFEENCPKSSEKQELNELWNRFSQSNKNADKIQENIIAAKKDNISYDDISPLENLIQSYEEEANKIVEISLNSIEYTSIDVKYHKYLVMLMKKTERNVKVAKCVVDDNALPEEKKQTLIDDSHALREKAYHSIVDAMKVCRPGAASEQIDEAITVAQQHVRNLQLFPFGKTHDSLTESDNPLRTVDKIWETFDKIKLLQHTFVEEEALIQCGSDVIDNVYEYTEQSIIVLSIYGKINEETRKKAANDLKEVSNWQKEMTDYIIEEIALKAIKHSPEHEKLNKLKERAENAKEAINKINSNGKLSDKEMQIFIDRSSRLFDQAYSSIIDAVIACRPQADPDQRNKAIVRAQGMVLQVEMNALKYSRPQDHQTLSSLISNFEKAVKATEEAINDNKYLVTKEEKKTLLKKFRSQHQDAYHSIVEAVKICADQEESGQRNKAIREVQQYIGSLKNFLHEERYQMTKKRITSLQDWYESMASSYTAESPMPELPIQHFLSAQRLEESIKEYIDGSGDPSEFDPRVLDIKLGSYSEVCRQIQEAGIEIFIATNSNKDVKQSALSLRNRADQAYEELINGREFKEADQKEAYALYNNAYNDMMRYLEFFSMKGDSDQEKDRTVHQIYDEAEKQIKHLKYKVTKQTVADWRVWFDKNCPPDSQQPELRSVRTRIDQAMKAATTIERQIAEAELGDDSSLLVHFKSYEENKSILNGLVEEVIKSSSEGYKDLNTLVERAKMAKEAVASEWNNLSEEEKQIIRDVERPVRDAVRACGPEEDSMQRARAVTKASNEILQVGMIGLKQSHPQDYQTLSPLIATANEAAKEIINDITNNKNYVEEEVQILLNKFRSSYNTYYDSMAQIISICTSQENREQRDKAITEARQHVESFQLFLNREQFESTQKRVKDDLDWLTRNGPSSDETVPEEASLMKKLKKVRQQVTEIEQQITEAETDNISSLPDHFRSYEDKAQRIEILVRDVIMHSPEVASYDKVLMTLTKKAAKAKNDLLSNKNDLSEEEKQIIRDANRSVKDAVRACGPKEDSRQRDYTITKAENKVLGVRMIGLKQSHPQDYRTLSTLIATADKTAEGIINDINNNEHSMEEEKQILLNRIISSYKDIHASIAQAVSACEMQKSLEQKNNKIVEAEQTVFSLPLSPYIGQFESTCSRIESIDQWCQEYYQVYEARLGAAFNEDSVRPLNDAKAYHRERTARANAIQSDIKTYINRVSVNPSI